jgi:hypothetical protein
VLRRDDCIIRILPLTPRVGTFIGSFEPPAQPLASPVLDMNRVGYSRYVEWLPLLTPRKLATFPQSTKSSLMAATSVRASEANCWIVVGQEEDALELSSSEPSLHGDADAVVGSAEDHAAAITGSVRHGEMFATGLRNATRMIHSSLSRARPTFVRWVRTREWLESSPCEAFV